MPPQSSAASEVLTTVLTFNCGSLLSGAGLLHLRRNMSVRQCVVLERSILAGLTDVVSSFGQPIDK